MMPLAGNPITLGEADTELGYSSTALITMNDNAVRTLAGVGGAGTIIHMSDLYGKSAITPYRATASAVTGTGGTSSNLPYAYDTSLTTVDNTTSSTISHAGLGTYSTTYIVTYSNFGSITKTGTLYLAFSGSLTDNSLTAVAELNVSVNGTSVTGFPIYSSGGTSTFSHVAGSALTVALTSQNLATLSVAFLLTGGKVTTGDAASVNLSVFDLLFE